jgi:hypothetical protein
LQQVVARHSTLSGNTASRSRRLAASPANGFTLFTSFAIAGLFVVLSALEVFEQSFFEDQLLEDAHRLLDAAVADDDRQCRAA